MYYTLQIQYAEHLPVVTIVFTMVASWRRATYHQLTIGKRAAPSRDILL